MEFVNQHTVFVDRAGHQFRVPPALVRRQSGCADDRTAGIRFDRHRHHICNQRTRVGGPLGAYFPRALFDTPFGYEEYAGKGGLIGHAGITVFDDSADMLKQARFAMEFCAIESCGKCTPCRIGSTRGVETVDKIAKGIEPEKNKVLLEDLCNTMKFGSLCALGGFTPYPVRSALKHWPEDFGK